MFRIIDTRRLCQRLHAVFSGEAAGSFPASRLQRSLREEDGLITWVTLVAILFLLIMACLIGNVGHVLAQKIETQNAADSAAYSGTIWMARGMNAITAANHLQGELMGLYVLHHAIGGKWLDEHCDDEERNTEPWDEQMTNKQLERAWKVGDFIFAADRIPDMSDEYPVPVGSEFDDSGFVDPQTTYESYYEVVREDPIADVRSLNYEAKLRLKYILALAYEAHIKGFECWLVGWICEKTVILAALGEVLKGLGDAIMWTAYLVEMKDYQEYATLNALEALALRLSPIKQKIPTVMDGLRLYQQGIISKFPDTARTTAQRVGVRNRSLGLFTGPDLPVVAESTDDEQRSQLMRATFPWVAHWRAPLLDFFSYAEFLSGGEGLYRKWTSFYSLKLCTLFREQPGDDEDNKYDLYSADRRGYRLYVLPDLNPGTTDKGDEPWTSRKGSAEADQLFCWVAIARRDQPPLVLGRPIFRQENPDGVMCMTQAMLYNANPQLAGDSGDWHQPRAGWDTLNWGNLVPEYWADSSDEPKIKLNWQAKLTPLTPGRIQSVPGDLRAWKLTEDRKSLNALIKRIGVTGALGNENLMTH